MSTKVHQKVNTSFPKYTHKLTKIYVQDHKNGCISSPKYTYKFNTCKFTQDDCTSSLKYVPSSPKYMYKFTKIYLRVHQYICINSQTNMYKFA